MALLAVIMPLIVALVPYLVQLVEWLANQRRLRPAQQQWLGRLMYHCGRLREACEKIEARGSELGCVV